MPDTDPLAKSGEKEWNPEPATLAPINSWPPRPLQLFKWLFGFPGFLWPENLLVFGITLTTWTISFSSVTTGRV
jgi:hypothetical protein